MKTMSFCRAAFAAAFALPLAAAFAGPIPYFTSVDGVINGSDSYDPAVTVTDSGDQLTNFANTGLDINNAYFGITHVAGDEIFYVGFDTVNGAFNSGSSLDPTTVTLYLYNDDMTAGYIVDLKYTGSGESAAASVRDLSTYQPITIADGDAYDYAATSMEAGIKTSYFSDLISSTGGTFNFTLRVGDFFLTHIDQVSGTVTTHAPEPATFALFAAGTLLMTVRRRTDRDGRDA